MYFNDLYPGQFGDTCGDLAYELVGIGGLRQAARDIASTEEILALLAASAALDDALEVLRT